MKTYTHLWLLCLLFCLSCKIPYEAESYEASVIAVNRTDTDTLSAIAQLLRPYRDSLDRSMHEVIGIASADFKKEKPSGTLGFLVVNAMYEQAVDIDPNIVNAVCNYGGIRLPEIKKGEITLGKIFELLPFDNELVLLDVQGNILIQWLNLIDSAGGWPVRNAYQFRGAGIVRMDGKTIDPVANYVIATNDYLAGGGDNCYFLKSCKRRNTGMLIRDLMIRYIRFNHNIYPAPEYQIK